MNGGLQWKWNAGRWKYPVQPHMTDDRTEKQNKLEFQLGKWDKNKANTKVKTAQSKEV